MITATRGEFKIGQLLIILSTVFLNLNIYYPMRNFLFLLNHARHTYILNNLRKKIIDQGYNIYIGSRNFDKPHLAEIIRELNWDTFLLEPITSRSPLGIVLTYSDKLFN